MHEGLIIVNKPEESRPTTQEVMFCNRPAYRLATQFTKESDSSEKINILLPNIFKRLE